ncbi:maltase A1-like [Bombus vancouverensis nearcticus]|uniref:maltase A1-like n=1 Tax=Bombus vancouverensis nearcticus TaxID=2705178 RepID=UPI00143871DC|nr:maltase A1-like [Bombus vancouverensis nearcticus]
MFRLTITSCFLLFALSAAVDVNWFKNAIVYQIYPRSFKDSNGDGIGDLNGITSKLEHIKDIGATALWLSPIYKSPQVDFGYDISNFTDIEPTYGTLADFDKLVAKAKSLGLKVILDFVPNHSSPEHPWFKKSVQKIKPYDEYYVWRDAKIVNGTRKPPNNWLSNFGGSAWEWNNVRKQYYLHQFAAGQPDLNYRNKGLDQEIKNVFTFWMNRGVDGFRIDAINFMFEDIKFRDEPSANRTDIPSDDYDSLLHIYTLDQNETYGTLNSWRKLMNDHSNRTNSDPRLILTEAYTTHERTMKYYTAGSNVPFNFMFITSLNNKSTAMDYKNLIDKWVKSVPSGNVPNWVVGNHDNHRVASRFGTGRANMIIQMAMVLPGIAVIYNGDEIGMVDRPFTYKETVDPAGCNAGPARYYLKSRDPERTPFQWDSTTSAGFSNSTKTWLPVHPNYKTLNLAAQKRATSSPYQLFKQLMNIKKRPVIARGSLNVSVLDKQVLGITRTLGSETVIVMLNFGNEPVKVNARASLSVPPALVVYAADVDSYPRPGTMVFTNSITIPASSSVMYTSPNIYRSMNE